MSKKLVIIALSEEIAKGLSALGKPLASFPSIERLVEAISPSDYHCVTADTKAVANHISLLESYFQREEIDSNLIASTFLDTNERKICVHALSENELVFYGSSTETDVDLKTAIAVALNYHVSVENNIGWHLLADL